MIITTTITKIIIILLIYNQIMNLIFRSSPYISLNRHMLRRFFRRNFGSTHFDSIILSISLSLSLFISLSPCLSVSVHRAWGVMNFVLDLILWYSSRLVAPSLSGPSSRNYKSSLDSNSISLFPISISRLTINWFHLTALAPILNIFQLWPPLPLRTKWTPQELLVQIP